jgi:hypothetical protein
MYMTLVVMAGGGVFAVSVEVSQKMWMQLVIVQLLRLFRGVVSGLCKVLIERLVLHVIDTQ